MATQLQSDYVILDDFAACRKAIRLVLNVKSTLAIIKKMMIDGKVKIDDIDRLYQQLLQIKFRFKRSILRQFLSIKAA